MSDAKTLTLKPAEVWVDKDAIVLDAEEEASIRHALSVIGPGYGLVLDDEVTS
jgi:hypothetical protein